MNKSFKSPVVILANGAFPISKISLDQLKSAGTVICTDGSANNLSNLGLTPHVIIGDMDSIDSKYEFKGLKIHDNNTENSDLEKALNWVIMSNISDISVLGSTGLREDMTLANLHILFHYYDKISIKIITDHFTVTCHKGEQLFDSFHGENVSLFAQKLNSIVTTKSLKYQLKDSSISPPQKGISNQSTGSTFSVECSDPILVFRGHPK